MLVFSRALSSKELKLNDSEDSNIVELATRTEQLSESPGVNPYQSASALDAHVGHKIRERREILEITQTQLARELGVTFSQVQKYERGLNRIGAGRLFLIAKFLEVPVTFFFEKVREQPPSTETSELSCVAFAELVRLNDAFRSIDDFDIRASVLALVQSLAECEALAKKSH
jgi:transcriptional regulator with XRE-family HTH domain